MVSPRLSLVLNGHDPFQQVVVYRPRAGADFSALQGADIKVIQGFKPDYDALEAAGCSVEPELLDKELAVDLAVVAIPRAKAEARALIAQASATAKYVLVDGQKTDGIDSLLKEVRKRTEIITLISKAHGKAFLFEGGDFSDWVDPGYLNKVEGFATRLGVFSVDKIDKASAALVQALPDKMPAKMADFGAGWGYLSHHVLQKSGVKSLKIIEAEFSALECAKKNIPDERAQFLWKDIAGYSAKPGFDGIVMNPPFHTTRAADPGLGQIFIASAARCLAPHGQLWMVANRHLPYEDTLKQHFLEVNEFEGTSGFKILHAVKPLRAKGRTA